MQSADIVILLTRMNIGGPAQQALLLARQLGVRWPTILAAGRPDPSEGELADPEVPVVTVPLVRPVRPATDVRAVVSVRRLMVGSRARLLHTHMAKAGTVGRLAALSLSRRDPQRERPRTVHTFHGHVLEGYFNMPTQRAFLQVERFLARHTDMLIAVSPEIRDELVDLGIGTASRYCVVPLGVDFGDLPKVGTAAVPTGTLRSSIGVGPEVPLAGVLGRLVPVKDHATLFEAMAALPGVHLAVLGDGELRGQLEELAQRLGIADRTHFTGWWRDMPGALADLDVVALSSVNEGTPVALIEALAAGRPVVATDVGGVRHVVRDAQTGWLCPRGDAASLARLLSVALTDRATAERLGQEGRRQVLQRFGSHRMVADHIELYEELLGPHGRSG